MSHEHFLESVLFVDITNLGKKSQTKNRWSTVDPILAKCLFRKFFNGGILFFLYLWLLLVRCTSKSNECVEVAQLLSSFLNNGGKSLF